jgi:hypothetical protein
MRKLKLFSLLCLLLIGVGQVWATDALTTFANKTSGTWAQNTSPLPCATGGNEWESSVAPYGWDNSDRGLQFTCTASVGATVTLTSSDFQNKIIKSVSVVASRNKTYDVNLSVSVNGNTLGTGDAGANNQSNATLTTSDDTGINCGTGNIEVTLSTGAPASQPKSMYIKSITVTYEESGSSTKPTLFSVHPFGVPQP